MQQERHIYADVASVMIHAQRTPELRLCSLDPQVTDSPAIAAIFRQTATEMEPRLCACEKTNKQKLTGQTNSESDTLL